MNRIVWLSLTLVMLVSAVSAVAAVGGLGSSPQGKRIFFGGANGYGSAIVASTGEASAARVTVALGRLTPRASVRVLLRAGTCAQPGASVVRVLAASADAAGSLLATGRVTFRGEPVPFATIAGGSHTLTIVAGGRSLGCEPIRA